MQCGVFRQFPTPQNVSQAACVPNQWWMSHSQALRQNGRSSGVADAPSAAGSACSSSVEVDADGSVLAGS
jgi:hypothetical protein